MIARDHSARPWLRTLRFRSGIAIEVLGFAAAVLLATRQAPETRATARAAVCPYPEISDNLRFACRTPSGDSA